MSLIGTGVSRLADQGQPSGPATEPDMQPTPEDSLQDQYAGVYSGKRCKRAEAPTPTRRPSSSLRGLALPASQTPTQQQSSGNTTRALPMSAPENWRRCCSAAARNELSRTTAAARSTCTCWHRAGKRLRKQHRPWRQPGRRHSQTASQPVPTRCTHAAAKVGSLARLCMTSWRNGCPQTLRNLWR